LTEREEQAVDGLKELLDASADMKLLGEINKDIEMGDFMAADRLDHKLFFNFNLRNSIADGAFTLEEIVAEICAVDEEVNETSVLEIEAEEPSVGRQEAQLAWNKIRLYVQKNFDDPAILGCSDKLDEAFYQKRKKNAKQTLLTDFFR
jgi:hypothetical protein